MIIISIYNRFLLVTAPFISCKHRYPSIPRAIRFTSNNTFLYFH